MADVLLTHSYHLPYDTKQSQKMQPYVPLGTLYAATALRENGVSVAVFDAMLQAPEAGFRQMLQSSGAKIVVVYEDDFNFLSKMCLTRMREVAWTMASYGKAAGAITIVHGSDSTDHPELFLANGFDYVLCGEAESALVTLCSSLLQGNEPPSMDGLVRMREGATFRSSVRRLATNPDWTTLPLPARDLISLEPYRSAWIDRYGYFSTNLAASRGCPFHCNWCAKPISGNRFRLRDASSVAEEMALLKQCGVEHLWFSDDVFALNHHWVEEFAAEVQARDASIPFKIQSRADLLRADTVLHLKAAGCAEVWMGVESGSQKILDAMDKGICLSDISTARGRLRTAGIRACFFLQFGYPGETWTELEETIALVRDLRPDDIGISFSYPLPGTVFYERVQSQMGMKRNWTDSDDLCIMFKAAYTTEFYRAVRDALHAEVESWRGTVNDLASLWRRVEEMEPQCRVEDSFTLGKNPDVSGCTLIPIEQLTRAAES